MKRVLLLLLGLSACGPVTGIALLQNNTEFFDFVRRSPRAPEASPSPTASPNEMAASDPTQTQPKRAQ